MLSIPDFFNPDRAGEVWPVPYSIREQEAHDWANQHHISPSAEDQLHVGLLLIDYQNTFCLPGFELFIGEEAINDTVRLCQFVYRNLTTISRCVVTVDTHSIAQIFHRFFWVNGSGEHPTPFTTISVEDVESGIWKVNPQLTQYLFDGTYNELCDYALQYVKLLRFGGQYDLTIWPYHALLGGIGHALVPSIEEAVFFHSIARHSPACVVEKGKDSLSEHYSAFRPEVSRTDNDSTNYQYLEEYDRLVVAGQAKSHCVAASVQDLIVYASSNNPPYANHIYLLEDCTTAVPGFERAADQAFRSFSQAGIHIVRSTDPIIDWPSFIS